MTEHSSEPRRERKARRTRDALADAALDLVLERGPEGYGVEDVTDRVDVSRRTFSRYFATKEEAALDFLRQDLGRVNALVADRPADESPVEAYVAALRTWMREDEHPAWHRSTRSKSVLRLVEGDAGLRAAYRAILAEAQDETARVAADRLGVRATDLRPATLAAVATSGLTTAGRAWLAGDDLDLPDAIDQVFAILHTDIAAVRPRPA
ncbi:acyl-CoA-like ligand-binding transcription factor [Cellulomonas edaphi]|uniref:TetR family transcriptional regulator n=1 Tax=Cellulomonas edaphi TaxID=3053468 RepID=A0ABT7S8K0_9CELL|nr:TetR family transcriptional regulator [Cellulomons edaphi]MDM7831950.1 TetR family transcriptional regulator [Cellulomons edaphi]